MNRLCVLSASVLVGFLTLSSGPAGATTWFEEKFTCPIGGETFKTSVVMSNSTFGQRPDGKRYSPLPVYPVVECPDNGLLLFKEDFSEEELALLAAAIATDEFQAMRKQETQHYRVWWLKKQINLDPVSQADSLLVASWETDHDAQRKIRYQVEFVNLVMAMTRSEENAVDWFWLNMRAINAMRELGYFAEGLARLNRVMAPKYLPSDDSDIENAKFFGDQLRALLEQENPYKEPANLVPAQIAIFRCVAPVSSLTEVEYSACASEPVQTEIEKFSYKPEDGELLHGEAAIRAARLAWREHEHDH